MADQQSPSHNTRLLLYSTLKSLHYAGFEHHDFFPRNVVIPFNADANPLLIDFTLVEERRARSLNLVSRCFHHRFRTFHGLEALVIHEISYAKLDPERRFVIESVCSSSRPTERGEENGVEVSLKAALTIRERKEREL